MRVAFFLGRGSSVVAALIALLFTSSANAANTADVMGQWSGLDKTNFGGQLRQVVIQIHESEPPVTAGGRGQPRSVYSPAHLETISFAGTFVSSVSSPRYGTQSETADISGYFHPETNTLLFYWEHAGRVRNYNAQIAVLSPDSQSMAIFHSGQARNSLPYVLKRGDAPPETLKRISGINTGPNITRALPPNPLAIMKARKQQQAAAKAQQEAAMAQLQASQKLQKEMVEAARAGDHQRVQELRQQLQDIALHGVAQQTGQIPAGSPMPARPSGTGCPQHILDWASEMEAHGASQMEFTGLIQVANLFRPEAFIPHFGKTFDELGKQEVFTIGMDMQRRCLTPATPLYRSPIATSLASAFGDQGGFNRFDATSAALALEVLAAWQDAMNQAMEESGSIELAEAYEFQREKLAASLWPSEAESAKGAMVETISRKAVAVILERLEGIVSRLQSQDTMAFRDLMLLRKDVLFQKLSDAQKPGLESEFWQRCDPALESSLQRTLSDLRSTSDPYESLSKGKRWYGATGDSLGTIAQRPAYRSFIKEFGALREAAFSQLRPAFFEQLDGIEDRNEAAQFGSAYAIGIDPVVSPTWREIQQRRETRVDEIDRAAFVARVGDGPFHPDYPGAIYLNAIYRGDTQRLADEDRRFQEPMIAYLQPLLQPGLMDFFGLLTGNIVTGDQLREIMLASARRQTVLEPLLAYFVVNYEGRYPGCMDAEPARIKRTTVWENVTRWSDGFESRSYGGTTYDYFLVNERHKGAWMSFEGKAKDPESVEFINWLGKVLSPNGKDYDLSSLSQGLRGLRQAMADYPCDSDVIETLETNMLALYEGTPLRRNPVVKTSWKKEE